LANRIANGTFSQQQHQQYQVPINNNNNNNDPPNTLHGGTIGFSYRLSTCEIDCEYSMKIIIIQLLLLLPPTRSNRRR